MNGRKTLGWRGTSIILAIIAITTLFTCGCPNLISISKMEHLSAKLDGTGMTEKIENKAVLIVFWARMSTPCKELLPELCQLQNKYRDKGLVIITVNQDGIESASAVAATLQEFKAELKTIHDSGQISDEFRVEGLPAAYLFNRKHILVEQKEIDTDDIKQLEAAIVKVLATE